MDTTEKRRCYYILLSQGAPYRPVIVEEGTSGYCRTDWEWGDNLADAERLAAEKNERLGLTPEDVEEIITSSMAAISV